MADSYLQAKTERENELNIRKKFVFGGVIFIKTHRAQCAATATTTAITFQ